MPDHEEVWELEYYKTKNGLAPFLVWFESLNDFRTQTTISARLARLRLGNFGKCEPVGNGVFELKIYYGPGYRVYFGRKANRIILLLCGGDKSTQGKDIQRAYDYWQNFKERLP
ncbi:MAG: type II toxin-antitoxin system RelE/ParE family toxin [Candidatus Omnitrophica bacterium]|nr:type II toxin-antitoxin system RelE/ParE family toxin [Candidatus Omnitrophota bacterium]